MRNPVLSILIVLSTVTVASAQQRPLVTEDPETIGLGLVLLEGGFDFQRSVFYPVSGLEGNLLRLPTLGVSFGLSPTAELQIDGGLYNRLSVNTRQPAPLSNLLDFTGDHTSDVEDLTIATKIRVASGEARPARGRPALRHAPAECEQRERARARHDRLLCFDADREDGAIGPARRQCRTRNPG